MVVAKLIEPDPPGLMASHHLQGTQWNTSSFDGVELSKPHAGLWGERLEQVTQENLTMMPPVKLFIVDKLASFSAGEEAQEYIVRPWV